MLVRPSDGYVADTYSAASSGIVRLAVSVVELPKCFRLLPEYSFGTPTLNGTSPL